MWYDLDQECGNNIQRISNIWKHNITQFSQKLCDEATKSCLLSCTITINYSTCIKKGKFFSFHFFQIQGKKFHGAKCSSIGLFKLQKYWIFLDNLNFTKSSYFMMMEKFEYHIFLKQLNEGQILIFDGIMHKKNHTLVYWFFKKIIRGAGTSKIFTLKLIIQGLLQLYNKNISFESTSKDAFTIDGLTIHSTLHIFVQQS